MAYGDNEPAIRIGGARIDPLSEIRNAGIITSGRVYWVKATADSDYTTVKDQVGGDRIVNDLQTGINMTRSDKNDYVMVIPQDANAVYTIGTSLQVNKNRIHIIGVGYTKTQASYAVTFRGYATTAAGTPLDSSYMTVTGGGVELAGIRIQGTAGTCAGGTVTNGVLAVGTGAAGTAHDLWVHDSAFELTPASLGTPAVITTPGTVHGARFDNVWVGNVAAGVESAGNAGVVRLGNGGKRWNFNDSVFVYNAGSTTDQFVAAGTGATEYALFKRCTFINMASGQAMASAVRGSTTTTNPIMMVDCRYVNVTQAGTDPTVFKVPVQSGTRAVVYDEGIAVGTAALIAV